MRNIPPAHLEYLDLLFLLSLHYGRLDQEDREYLREEAGITKMLQK